MKAYLNTKKPQISILLIFVVLYLIIFLITKFATSLHIIEFAFLTLAIGFAPAYYFRNTFTYKDLVGWLIHAAVLGVIFIPFLFLFFGWLRINIIFEYSILFIYLCSILGILSLFFKDGAHLQPLLVIKKFDVVDVIVSLCFIAFTLLLTLHNFDEISINWDAFTYWSLDSKYIFLENQLRDKVFQNDVHIFRYTSFHPLYHAIIYDLYGAIVEQFASWINVYANFLAMFLVYLQVREKSLIHKLLVASSVLIISFTAIKIVNMYSVYADVISSFLLVVYMVVLINGTERKLEGYWQRVVLLLLISISFFFIKSPFLMFTVLLVGVWLSYDFKFILNNWKRLLRSKGFWLAIILIVALLTMRSIYFSILEGGRTEISETVSILQPGTGLASIQSYLEYILTVSQYLLEGTPYLIFIWLLTLLSILFVKNVNKKYLVLYFAAVLIFLIPIAGYVLKQRPFHSQSLNRYTAIAMYLYPLVLGYVDIAENKLKKIAASSIFALLTIFVFLNILIPVPLFEKFSLSDGTFETELAKYHKFAENAVEIAGEESRILIVDNLSDERITNMIVPDIFIRYFMIDNNVGAQYNLPVSDLVNLISRTRADFILLLSYKISLEDCGQFFDPGRDYLVDIRSSDFATQSGKCPFTPADVIDLGEAIR